MNINYLSTYGDRGRRRPESEHKEPALFPVMKFSNRSSMVAARSCLRVLGLQHLVKQGTAAPIVHN